MQCSQTRQKWIIGSSRNANTLWMPYVSLHASHVAFWLLFFRCGKTEWCWCWCCWTEPSRTEPNRTEPSRAELSWTGRLRTVIIAVGKRARARLRSSLVWRTRTPPLPHPRAMWRCGSSTSAPITVSQNSTKTCPDESTAHNSSSGYRDE